MHNQQSISAIFPRIEQSIRSLLKVVGAMPPALVEKPLLVGERSVKDVLGHLTWWDQWLLTTLPPAAGSTPLAIRLPLADQIPAGNEWADEMNDKVLHYNKTGDYSVLWDELRTTCELLLNRVSQLTDGDLNDPEGISKAIGQPLAPLICGIYEHYEDHLHEFETISA